MSDGQSTTSSEYHGYLPPILQGQEVVSRPEWLKEGTTSDVGMGNLDLNSIGAFDITNWYGAFRLKVFNADVHIQVHG